MIGLGHPGRRDGGTTRPVSLDLLLLTDSALRQPAHVVGRVGEFCFLARPALLELHAGIGVPVHFRGVALATLADADRVTFPPRFRVRVVTVGEEARVIANALFLITDRDAVHDRAHPWYTAREHYRVLGLLIRVHPAGELDRALANAADVHRPFAQDRIVSKRLEHALFEPTILHGLLDLVVIEVILILREVVGHRRRSGVERRIVRATPADLLGESAEAADALRHQHADGKTGRGTQQHGRHRAGDRVVVIVAKAQW